MSPEQYYIAPPDDVFAEIKTAALTLWGTYDDVHGYRTGKINRIADLMNISDNAWYMVAMFDYANQVKLMLMVSEKTRNMIMDAMGYNERKI